MSQQAIITSENPYLQQGDWIQLQYEGLFLFSQGFKSAQVSMKATNDCPLLSLFNIQHVNQYTKNNKKYINFNQPVVLIHRFSSKYLSFTPNFANKSQFKLRSALSDHCQFYIRPLYKCQTLRGNIVKNGQQCMLSPALAQYATENINMVVGKFQKNTQGKVPIFLKKNEFSNLRIHRKNLQKCEIGHISNLQIYQLGHLQKKKWLSCSKDTNKNTYQAKFNSSYVRYDSLLKIELYYDNPQQQVQIKKGDYIAFKFIGSKRYLAFSDHGQVYFVEQKTQYAAFSIELYNNDKNLDDNSLLKIKHTKTQKYLSFNENSATLQQFRAYNIFQLNKLASQDLKSTLFINQVYNSIEQYVQDAANMRRKRAVTSILKEIIKFIFKNKNIYEQFLTLQPIKYFITEQQQNLFSSVGFITLLKDISSYCFGFYQVNSAQIQDKKSKSIENMSHQYNQQQHIYIQICIIIVGICKNNRDNIVKFSENLKIYYQHIGKIKGSIELLYHIYCFNAIGLEVLQNQQFSLKNYQIKAIDLLFQFLYKRQFSLQTRTKLIKLFHGCIINDKNEKIHSHQQSMLTVFYENRFKNIMFTLSNNLDYEVIVSLKTEREELSNMIDNQDKYKLQLELLYEQIDLLTTLCSRASKKHVNLFRDMISEDMVKNYIKLRLNSQFKSLFLKILVNVYLNKDLSVSSQALIVITNPKKKAKNQTALFRKFSNLSELSQKMLSMNEQIQMQDVHQSKFKFMANVNSLNEIKQLVKKNIKTRLEKNQIQNQLIYCLYAINNFLEVQICNWQQGQQILELLANYLRINYEDKKLFNNDLVQKFLGIFQLNLQQKIKVKICNLFLKIREGYRQVEQKIKYSKKIVSICNQFMHSQLTNLVNPQLLQLLQNIINYSVETQSYNIFQKTSKLYHKIDKINFYFLQMTKGSIPIQSDISHDNLRKINKIYNSLTDYTIEYIYYHDNTVEVSKLRKTITHLINQTVQLLQTHEDEEPINIMVQKMVGQFNFFDIIIQLIYQRQKDLQNIDNNQLFQSIFKFIYLLFMNSDQNFLKNAKKIPKIKAIYQYQDRGQIRLLWNLTCMKTITTRLNNFIFDCWVTATRNLSQYSIYISLGFLKLIEPNQEQLNQINNIKNLVKLILSENSILQHMLKGLSLTEQIFTQSYCSNARQQWLFNIFLVMKLLIFVYNQSKQSKLALTACYRKYIPLKTLIKLIEQSFAFQFEGEDENKNIFILISLKLLKKYLLTIFNILYLSGQMEFEYLLYIAQKIAIRLTIKNSEMISDQYIFKNLMFYNKHTQSQETMKLREVIIDYLKFQNPSHFEITPQDFHKYINNTYLFINVYYDFLFKVCQKMIEINLQRQDNTINMNTSVSTRQIDIFIQNIFKKYKQFIAEKLTYSQYAAYVSAYSKSIKSTQQIVKKKVGLHFNYQASDEDGISLLQGQQYFHNKQISYVFNCYLQSKLKVQRYLFESMLIMAYNPNLIMTSSSHKSCFDDSMKAIFELILAMMKNEQGNFRQKCQILYSFIEMNKKFPEWQPSLQYGYIIKQLTSVSEDMNSSNLKYYILCEKRLLQHYFSFKSNNFNRCKKLNFESSDQFSLQFLNLKNKIKNLIQLEIKYHDKKMLIDQSIVYFQSKKLNYQIFPIRLNIEQILEWILLKIKYNVDNINRYYELILEVTILLKAYTKFIYEYDKKYISAQIQKNIQLCLKIIFRAITGNNLRMMMVLIQKQIWVQLNLILSLNDTLQQNLEQLDLKTYDLIKLITRVKLDSLQSTYVQGVLQLYNNSISIYGQKGEILTANQFPLIPIKSYFHETKYIIAIIIKQFKHLPPNIATQFYSKLDSKYIQYNILNSFQKFNYLYGSYSIATIYPKLDYGGSKQQALAYSIAIQNGVQFSGIKMYMDMLNGRYELMNIFNRHRIQINRHQKVQNFFDTLKNFFIDLLLLFASIFYSNKKRREKSSFIDAVTFFLTKMSKVQIMFQDQIYVQDFMIYPQCKATRRMKRQLLGSLNFLSNQLKRESIILAIQRFNLNYENQLRFFHDFIKFKLMLFMAKYLSVLKNLSYLIVVINNIFLMVNQLNVSVDQFDVDFPFYILAFVNFMFSILILVIYCVKDLPLVLKIHKYELSQGLGYFGRKFNQKSQFKKILILALMIFTNLRLLYNLIYTIIVGLIFINPIFASILLLDVLAHVPSLKTLLLSIWRPKYSLCLTMIAYVILQYFFSILLYFLFKNQASPYCDHLGDCFSFIFQTTFKAVHGFVGYLFLQSTKNGLNKQITIFSIFQDIYVIFIYQIVIGLILAIVIDSFTVARTQKLKQLDNLSHSCVVCNIQRSKFNIESKLGFKGHVYISHNIFSYIDFKYGITIKPYDYLTDFELSALGDNTSLWIPDNRTKQLEFQKPYLNPKIAKNQA